MTRLAACLAVAAFLAAIAFRTWTTALGFPALAVDAPVFLPQAVSFARDGSLINPVWATARGLDPLRLARMTYHGFLYPMLVGSAMPSPDAPALTRTLAAIHALAALLFPLLLWRFARIWQVRLNAGVVCWIALLSWVSAHYTLSEPGRPEPLAALMLTAAVLAGSWIAPAWQPVLAGAFAGALGAAHPLVGFFTAIGICGWAAWRWRMTDCARHVAIAGGCAVAVFALILIWYPYSFGDWVIGMRRMGGSALDPPRVAHMSRMQSWMWAGPRFFFLGVFGLVAASGWRFLARRHREGRGPAAPAAFYVVLLVALAAIWRLAAQVPWSNYNLMPFVPPALLLVFRETARSPGPSAFAKVAGAVLLVAAIGPARDVLMRTHFLRSGVTLSAARKAFADFRATHPGENLAVHRNLFTLTEDLENVTFWKNEPPDGIHWLVVPEAYGKTFAPADIAGFELAGSLFNPQPPVLLGIPFAADNKGNGFAIYRARAP